MSNEHPPLVPPHPTPTADGQLIAHLAELVELERELGRAINASVAPTADRDEPERRVDGGVDRTSRAIKVLSAQLSSLGASPPSPEETRDLLPHSAEEVADSDVATRQRLLDADRSRVLARYDAAIAYGETSPDLRIQLQELRAELADGPRDD